MKYIQVMAEIACFLQYISTIRLITLWKEDEVDLIITIQSER